ncbi:MAG: hypothetical protein ACREP7_20185 [Lysobacter sp.]
MPFAGDTFQAALLNGLLATSDPGALLRKESPHQDDSDELLRRLLERAACAAALTCTRAGAELPYASELDRALRPL